MKIADSSLSLASSHTQTQQYELRERLRASIVSAPEPTEDAGRKAQATPPPAASKVELSATGVATQSDEAGAIKRGIEAANNDPKLRLLRAMIALLVGEDVNVYDLSDYLGGGTSGDSTQNTTPTPTETTSQASTDTPVPTGSPSTTSQAGTRNMPNTTYSVSYERYESYRETEQTSLAANGVVRTSDGKEIRFDLSLTLTRSYQEEYLNGQRVSNERRRKDPLVVNFAGTAAQLSNQRFKFDLDADGKTENINFATGGSGFLALDRNGDGKINDGSELFGATSGNGFAELAQFDSDHNGWIDENDSAYGQLRIWSKNEAGQDRLVSLKNADVGAISVNGVSTSFSMKDSNNDLQAQVRSSGVFLGDSGRVGSVQQIDLTI